MIFEVLVTIVGVAMSLGYFPQAYKIFMAKSARNVSVTSYWIFAFGTTVWLVYGISLKSWVIMLSFLPGVIGSWLVLILIRIYGKKK
jgi:uncharacterized protein with PQ loop repeat